ncbi:hypothetical protein FKW77_003354 [Venturia effusa]|uniref:Uncharacterized protein n=1 Tax=Venturia effusa TaxID=50376 RepID=A0A517LF54_9PEZI|nr:hypothetical protein FKW77_003354 [Venturia effusa]
MVPRYTTLRSHANGLSKTPSPPESRLEPPGVPSISQLKNELSEMLESTMGDSCNNLTLLDLDSGDKLIDVSSRPISSSTSSVTAQNETEDEVTPVEQCGAERYEVKQYYKERDEAGELHYVSNDVREYHFRLLQASDALSEDANACREHCYYLLASENVPRAVRCGALYLLAESSNSDGRRQEAKGFLEQALILCDEMDRVNEQQGVNPGTVPHERVQALRAQLFTISNAIKSSRVVVVSRHTTPSSSRASSQRAGEQFGFLESPASVDGEGELSGGCSATKSFLKVRASKEEEKEEKSELSKTKVDRCHITELEYELTRAREEESRAKRRVHQAKRRREGIEERLIKTRRLWQLQKV